MLLATCASAAAYDVAAYVWPAYHPAPRWAELGIFKAGKGEWQSVWEAVPKWSGHEQPRKPLWGYTNEADPKDVAQKIDAAVAHGVNVFIYDWYWYGGRPFLEDALNKGFLGAPNNGKMKFFIMWANHGVGPNWDNTRADKNGQIWAGEVSFDEYRKLVARWIELYFRRPNYYRIQDRPVVMLYELQTFIRGLGGVEKAREAIAYLKQTCQAAGLNGAHVMACDFGLDGQPVKDMGFDSATIYNLVHWSSPSEQPDYDAWAKRAAGRFDLAVERLKLSAYFPHASVGWDQNPRYPKTVTTSTVTNSTPAKFEVALRRAKDWADLHVPAGYPKLVTVNSWNEWTEGSYLEPDEKHGFGYLEAVQHVFGTATAPQMTLEIAGRRVDAVTRAQEVLRTCRKEASDRHRVHGFRVPFYAPGGAYGDNWWQLDHSVAVQGANWFDSADAARALDGFADVMRADGRIPLFGNDVIPTRKGWFSEQSEGLSSLPAFFRAAHAVAVWRGDRAFAHRMADLSFRYLNWWLRARGDPGTGLVTAVFEETFPPHLGWAGECASPGTCAEVAHGAELTADLYRRLGETARAETCRDAARRLYAAARTHLWDADAAQFRAWDVRTRTAGSADALGFSLLQDPGLPDEIRKAARATVVGPRYQDVGKFGATSVARDDPRFKITRGERYQGNASWNGMVWTLINMRLVDGLLASGFEADAVALARETARMLEAEDDFYEFYDPTDGKGCGVKGYAWTAADYLQLVLGRLLGISYDGFTGELTVKPRIPDDFRVTGLDIPGKGRATVRCEKGKVTCTFTRGN